MADAGGDRFSQRFAFVVGEALVHGSSAVQPPGQGPTKGFPTVRATGRHAIRRALGKSPDGQHPASNALQSRWFVASRQTMKSL